MGRHDDGRARDVDLREELDDVPRGVGVQVPRGLVRQEDRWVVHQGPGHGDPLLLAPRQLIGVGVGLVEQVHQLQRLRHPAVFLPPWHADNVQGVAHVLRRRLLAEEPEVLEDDADAPPQKGHMPLRQRGYVRAVHDDPARRGGLLSVDELQEGGLPHARSADEEAELPLLDGRGHMVQGLCAVGVTQAHIVELDHVQTSASRGWHSPVQPLRFKRAGRGRGSVSGPRGSCA